jgi:hypothetical protein
VPLYQREYAWGREEIWQLLDDLRDAFTVEPKRNYHLGSLTAFPRRGVGGAPEYELIDGQQRAITLGLFLRLLADAPTGLAGRLRFENRPEAEAFLAAFDAAPEASPALPQTFRGAVDAMLGHEVFGGEFAEKRGEFAKFVRERVLLFRVEMPPETDVSAYFEVMNNRGRQLEAADLIKARLVAKLGDGADKVLFDQLWTACSDMAGCLEDRFDEATAAALRAGSSWTQLANDKVRIADAPAEGAAPRSVIPDFPNFLLHAFRVCLQPTLGVGTAAAVPLDERRLRKTFDEFPPGAVAAEHFLDVLLKTRFRFDRFVVKAEGGADGGESRWRLAGDDSWTPEDRETRERLTHLESMLQVTYSSRRGKEWVSRVLLSNEKSAGGLVALLEGFTREQLAKWGAMEGWSCAGTGTPHLALNLVDYLMFCRNPEEYRGGKEFRFAYRNSVEHHFPQGSATEKNGWADGVVDDIGNLYLLSKSDNSALNVRGPEQKVSLAGDIDRLPPKRREMYRLTRDNGWTPEVMRKHSETVCGLLADFLKQ